MRARLVVMATILSAGAALAQPAFELEARMWQPDLTASMRSMEGLEGVDPEVAIVDLRDDLAMADQDFIDYRLTIHTGPRSRIRLGAVSLEYDGDAEVTRTLEFSGESYTVGTRVISNLTMDYYRLGWVWLLVGNQRARLGTVVEVKGVEIDGVLRAPDLEPPVDERESLSAVFPTVGLALDLRAGRSVSIFAEASGIDAGGDGRFIDAEAGVRIVPLPFLAVTGGWRLIDMQVEDGQDFAKLKDEGPFFGATLSF